MNITKTNLRKLEAVAKTLDKMSPKQFSMESYRSKCGTTFCAVGKHLFRPGMKAYDLLPRCEKFIADMTDKTWWADDVQLMRFFGESCTAKTPKILAHRLRRFIARHAHEVTK